MPGHIRRHKKKNPPFFQEGMRCGEKPRNKEKTEPQGRTKLWARDVFTCCPVSAASIDTGDKACFLTEFRRAILEVEIS